LSVAEDGVVNDYAVDGRIGVGEEDAIFYGVGRDVFECIFDVTDAGRQRNMNDLDVGKHTRDRHA